METFTLTLPDDTVLAGRHNLPAATAQDASRAPRYRPLVVGLHGGSYSSSYFDATPAYSARGLSDALSVPFVAIDRPGYGASTPVALVAGGDSFPEAWGRRLHQAILPALWRQFGAPQGCTCVVLHCHSLGVNGAIVAAALHAQDAQKAQDAQNAPEAQEAQNKQNAPEATRPPPYPLGGLVLSGFGSAVGIRDHDAGRSHGPAPGAPPPTHMNIPVAVKDSALLLLGTAADEVYAASARLDHAMPWPEIACLRTDWLSTWQAAWGAHVVAPVLIGLAGRDHYWRATEAHIRDFAAGFPQSTRVDTSLLPAAPHNLELSYWAAGWYAHSFGFALECAASWAVPE